MQRGGCQRLVDTPTIRTHEGCKGQKLIYDISDPNIYGGFTESVAELFIFLELHLPLLKDSDEGEE